MVANVIDFSVWYAMLAGSGTSYILDRSSQPNIVTKQFVPNKMKRKVFQLSSIIRETYILIKSYPFINTSLANNVNQR